MASYSTIEGTENFFQTHALHPDKLRKFQGLSISALGMGTYLGNSDDRVDELYETALISAVAGGVNLFDTANCYRFGRSEKVIGKVLKELDKTSLTRDQIVIATKAGFFPGSEEEDFEAFVRSKYLDKGLVKPNEIVAGCHSLSPAFLAHELEKSLHHLGISTIDLFYLHNPEMQLQEISENEFDERIFLAFEFLEKMTRENTIRGYGIATWNGFRLKMGSKALLQLLKFVEIAKKIAGENHHFQAIQLPYNLVMLESVKMKNQNSLNEEKSTIMKIAEEHKIAIFISAPLMQSQLLSLPKRVFDNLPLQATNMQKSLQFVVSTPNILAAMVGMKSTLHLQENIKILQEPNWNLEQMKSAYKVIGVS